MTQVATFGEAMLRLSVGTGHTLESAPIFDVHIAGAEANVAATLARLGREVTWVSKVPEGPLGRRVLENLRGAGVNCSAVVIAADGRLGTYYVESRPEPLPTRVTYDRTDSAASEMSADDIPWALFDTAEIIHLTGITPALSQSCLDATFRVAERARANDQILSIDVNYRSKLWSPEDASAALTQIIHTADLVICTMEDAEDLFDVTGDPSLVAETLGQRFDIARTVVTSGSAGAWWLHEGAGGHVPAHAVEIVDRIGAGDAFAAGVLDGVIDGNLELGVRRGTALAALALGTRGDRPLTSKGEVESMLGESSRRVDR